MPGFDPSWTPVVEVMVEKEAAAVEPAAAMTDSVEPTPANVPGIADAILVEETREAAGGGNDAAAAGEGNGGDLAEVADEAGADTTGDDAESAV